MVPVWEVGWEGDVPGGFKEGKGRRRDDPSPGTGDCGMTVRQAGSQPRADGPGPSWLRGAAERGHNSEGC